MDKELEIKKIIYALGFCNFEELSEENFKENIVNIFREKYRDSYRYDTGATKGVLLFPKFNFVIKIPFSGRWCYTDEEGDYFEEFCGTNNGDWNYCNSEVDTFREAQKNGIAECFLELKELTRIDNYPIYIQEYVSEIYCNSDDSCSSHTEDDIKKVKEICEDNYYDCFNTNWLGDVLNYYGKKVCESLLEFLEFMGINDLHGANLGYINKRPVIIDYGDFYD